MNNSLKLKQIAQEQFTIRNTFSIDQFLSKMCVIDHNRSKCCYFAITSSELEGYYNRIVHTSATLALLCVGIPYSKIHSMFSTIQRMVHILKASFSDSDITYGGDEIKDWDKYPLGVIQGNTSGPTIWSLLSSIIFEVLNKRSFPVKYCTSISKQVFHLVGFYYVDDCDIVQSGTDPMEVLLSIQDLFNS